MYTKTIGCWLQSKVLIKKASASTVINQFWRTESVTNFVWLLVVEIVAHVYKDFDTSKYILQDILSE